jgi:cobalt-zinc-cadmium resistance protein CzcA
MSLATVQNVIGAAIGGREAGVVYEGDRRFEIVVRLPELARSNIDALRELPVLLPGSGGRAGIMTLPLKQGATFTLGEGPNQISRENGKRRVVVTANVRGRDIASLVSEAQALTREHIQLPLGYWITWVDSSKTWPRLASGSALSCLPAFT